MSISLQQTDQEFLTLYHEPIWQSCEAYRQVPSQNIFKCIEYTIKETNYTVVIKRSLKYPLLTKLNKT